MTTALVTLYMVYDHSHAPELEYYPNNSSAIAHKEGDSWKH